LLVPFCFDAEVPLVFFGVEVAGLRPRFGVVSVFVVVSDFVLFVSLLAASELALGLRPLFFFSGEASADFATLVVDFATLEAALRPLPRPRVDFGADPSSFVFRPLPLPLPVALVTDLTSEPSLAFPRLVFACDTDLADALPLPLVEEAFWGLTDLPLPRPLPLPLPAGFFGSLFSGEPSNLSLSAAFSGSFFSSASTSSGSVFSSAAAPFLISNFSPAATFFVSAFFAVATFLVSFFYF
jgi:hypothetical protein